MARNSLLCADVPLRNYSLTHSLTHKAIALVTGKNGIVVNWKASTYEQKIPLLIVNRCWYCWYITICL